jgi:zinc transporter
VKSWAIELGEDGKGRSVDPVRACGQEGGRLRWVHLDGNAAETSGWLAQHGRLPSTVPHALTAQETRPRCEAIENGALLNLRGPAQDDKQPFEDRLVSIRIWVEGTRAISVGFRALAGLDELRGDMEEGRVADPGDIVSRLAIGITRRLDPVIAQLGDLVDECETALDPDSAFETRRRIAAARADAIVYRRFVVPEREALSRLAELDADWIHDDDRLHLRETADRFARMGEELEAVRERAALIHEQLTDIRSEQIERRGLLISVVALVFLPLTFITGLLGMNVDGIPFAHAPWAFAAVCGLCAVIAGVITAWFMAAHWFRR